MKPLLEELMERGLRSDRRYLFVLDGARALRAAIEKVFGERAGVQRCQIHKRQVVLDHLPEECRADWRRRLRNAWALSEYSAAKAAQEKLWRQLVEINPSAAHNLEEGLEETLTVHRLDVDCLRGARNSSLTQQVQVA